MTAVLVRVKREECALFTESCLIKGLIKMPSKVVPVKEITTKKLSLLMYGFSVTDGCLPVNSLD